MMSKAIRGNGFKGVISYALDQADARVLGSRNLGTADPRQVAGLMRTVANGSSRCRKPVYHLVIRPSPGDRELTDKELVACGTKMLKALGLEKHQALFVAHGKGKDQHLHVISNRVLDRKAEPVRHDFAKREKVCRDIEQSLGLRRVAGRFYDADGRDWRDIEAEARAKGETPPPRPRREKTDGELRREQRTGNRSRIHAAIPEILKTGAAGDRFVDELARRGLVLARGQKNGLIIVDPKSNASASFSRAVDGKAVRDRLVAGIDKSTLPTRTTAAAWLAQRDQVRPTQHAPFQPHQATTRPAGRPTPTPTAQTAPRTPTARSQAPPTTKRAPDIPPAPDTPPRASPVPVDRSARAATIASVQSGGDAGSRVASVTADFLGEIDGLQRNLAMASTPEARRKAQAAIRAAQERYRINRAHAAAADAERRAEADRRRQL